MFDWDDQELANIIWGENSVADDHIVPYPEDVNKKDLPDYADNNDVKKLNEEGIQCKAEDHRTAASKSISNGGKQEKNDGHSASGVIVDPQLGLSPFAASKTINKAIDKENQLNIGPEISQNQHDDKELGELVGNSWANIGSFDDLDRIFSHKDLDGQASLGSADDLWPSSKDLISEEAKSSSQALSSTSWELGALGNKSAHFQISSEYLHHDNNSLEQGCQKTDAISYSHRNIGRRMEQEEYAAGTTSLVKEKRAPGITVNTSLDPHLASENVTNKNKLGDKVNWSKNQLKHVQRTDKITDSRLVRDTYDSWPSAANVPKFDDQCAPATVQNYPASGSSQKQLPQDSSSMAYQPFSNPYVASCAYANQRPAMHIIKPTDDEHQSMLSNSETFDVISGNMPGETAAGPVIMTPQEKIEKLRRRQQMRAILAIQKQQQQFGHQATSVDYTLSQKSCAEDNVLRMEKADLEADENLSTLPCYDPSTPNKRDDSSTISDIDEYSAEDTVLYQLQDVISRLDLEIRLCIRDSLYRLAQSSMQRSYANDSSSTDRSSTYDIAKEETSSNDRFAGKVNMETKTNHIDRIVAHLLFHRPFKLPVKNVETPESSTSTKLSIEQETASPSSLPVGFLSKSSKNEYNLSPRGLKTSHLFVDSGDEDILKDNPQRETRFDPQMKGKTESLQAEHS